MSVGLLLTGSPVLSQPKDLKLQTQTIKTLSIRELRLPTALTGRLQTTKTKANVQLVNQNYILKNNNVIFRVRPTKEVKLLSFEQMRYTPSQAQIGESQKVPEAISKYNNFYKYLKLRDIKVVVLPPPASVDHRPQQTPVKDQQDRNCCVAFASLAAIERSYKPATLDLSEQFGYWLLKNKTMANVCDDGGFVTIDAADVYKANGVCFENLYPYTDYFGLGCPTAAAPSGNAQTNAKYRVKEFKKIWRDDTMTVDNGSWINNPKYLESVLAAGRDIVTGFYVAGWPPNMQGIIDVQIDPATNQPLEPIGGHAMLIVGYNRTGSASIGGGYFIIKNSWGTGIGEAGYVKLSYDYIRTYAKYGWYITAVEPVQ
jgi:C1A family cysteine protease